MNWEAIGSVAELLGALGVIASLVYLAAQIRHNTRSLRAATYESLAQATAASNILLISDPEIARIVEMGLGGDSLGREDRTRFVAYLRMTFRRYDSIFLHSQQGTLPPEAWEAYWNSFRKMLRSRNVLDFWEKNKNDYMRGFRDLVSKEISRALDESAA